MKKKLMVYLGLITIISSFFVVPISAVAETVDMKKNTEQSNNQLLSESKSLSLNLDNNQVKESLDIQPTQDSTKIEEMSSSKEDEVIKETELNSSKEVDIIEETEPSEQVEIKTDDDTSMFVTLNLNLDPQKPGNKYFTGERVQFYQTIEASSNQLNKEFYSIIKIPREFVDKESIKLHAHESVKRFDILETDEINWLVKISYKPITSGGIVAVPISFSQRNYTTAPNSETKVTSELYLDENVVATDSFSVYGEVIKPKITKEVYWNQINQGKVSIGLASKENDKISSDKKSDLTVVKYIMEATIGTAEGTGVFLPDSKNIIDYLPKEAVFESEDSYYNENWKYDQKTHTASFEIKDLKKVIHGKLVAGLLVYFPNTPEKEPILNHSELLDSEGKVVSKDSTSFIPVVEPNSPYISGGARKFAEGEHSKRPIGEKPDDIAWKIYPVVNDNPFNKTAYIKEIEDIVDNKQDYSKIKVNIPKDVTVDFISLYGAKEDEGYQLIQEKIPVGEEVLIGKEYRKIKVVFNTPIKFNKDIIMYLTTKVKDSLWGTQMDGKSVDNSVEITYSDPEGKVLGTGRDSDIVTYKGAEIGFYTILGNTKVEDGYINDTKKITYYVNFYNVTDSEEAIVVTLLPDGMMPKTDTKNILLIHNYLGTGKTAVIQKFNGKNKEQFISEINYELKGSLKKGQHKIQHYIYWKNSGISSYEMPSVIGRQSYILKNNLLDFDSKGTFLGRNILADHDEINYYPPLEVMVSKKIGTSPNNLSEYPIEVSDSDDIYYQLDLENRTNRSVEDYYLYDILPFKGDKLSNNRNQSNDNSRGSTNSADFSEIISKDDNLIIYYSSETNIEGLKTASWHKLEANTPSDQVKSLKLVPSTKLEPNQKMSVVFKVKAKEVRGSSVTKNAALLTKENQELLIDSNIVEAKNYKEELITISGVKAWVDDNNKDGNRPEKITVNLLADGMKVASREISKASDWKFEFKDLAKDKNQKEIKYSVEEVKVKNYETKIEDKDLTNIQITNTYKPEMTEVKGVKTWVDGNNKDGNRPEKITVNLLADGTKVDSREISKASDWKFEFKDLAKEKNQKEIKYSVEEVKVKNYETKVEDKDLTNIQITNTYKPEMTEVKGVKTWVDEDNKDGNRPEKITVNLLADGMKVASREISKASDWKFEFKDLSKDKNQKEIKYSVEEVKVKNYETTINKDDLSNIQITNTYKPEMTEVKGTKTWKDDNNQDGIRPEKITINLFGDDVYLKSQEVTAKTDWQYTFEELLKYKDGKEIVYTVTENAVPGYKTTVSGFNVTNTHDSEKTSVKVTKTWNDDNNRDDKRPYEVSVQLTANGEEIKSREWLKASNNWQHTWTDLSKNEDGKAIKYTIIESKVPEYSMTIDDTNHQDIKLVNTYPAETISIKGTKIWKDNDNEEGMRPEKITVNLTVNQEIVASKEVTAKNNWQFEFKDLPKFKEGIKIYYRVEEVNVPHYRSRVNARDTDNVVITNEYLSEKTAVKGTKTWNDNNNEKGNRPKTITVNLLADGAQVDQKEVSFYEGWKYEFNNLQKYKNGKEIVYTITENNIEDYTTHLDGTNIINTYTPGKTNVTVTKHWDDNNNQDGKRPEEIKVYLLANGKQVGGTVTLTAERNWSYTWSDLEQKENGKEIIYTVKEEVIPGYTTKVDSSDKGNISLTNTHKPETTEVKGTKTWMDDNDKEGNRPEKIIVNLLADGTKVDSREISKASDWQFEFKDLAKYKNNKEIKYSVEEVKVKNYETKVEDKDLSDIQIINTYKPEMTEVKGTKMWVDEDNKEGNRPEKITVNLLADGIKVASQEVSKASDWKFEFKDLAKEKNNKEIKYSVEEVKVKNYETKVEDKDLSNIQITNTYKPETTEVKGVKTWMDNDNQDGLRPENITINLLADGVKVDSQVIFDSVNWQFEFKDLTKYKNNQEIKYEVEEVKVSGYTTTIDRKDNANIKVVNTHTPEVTEVKGVKTWEDNDNQDGKRPETITVNLLADGKQIEQKEVSEITNWSYEFKNLPKYQKGQEIVYTVTENQVPEYQTEISGFNITNTYNPGKRSVTVTKRWADSENRDGIRPYAIYVQLLANGEKRGDVKTITAEDSWTYTWSGLDEKSKGKLIEYSVEEIKVAGYTPSIETETRASGDIKLTNTHYLEKIEIEGIKTWDDNNNKAGKRPKTITVNLIANGKQIDQKEVSEESDWRYEFKGLPRYQDGIQITYAVTENQVPEYSAEIKGYNITNRYTPGKTSVTVTKEWLDNNNQDGKRPENIKLQLLANGKKQGEEVTVTAEDKWSYTWQELDQEVDGKKINYTVQETKVPGYTTSIDDKEKGSIKLVNSYQLEKLEVKGVKIWKDNDNKAGKRPEKITVNLLADGKKLATKEVTEKTNWRYEFKELAKYQKGKEIIYTVTENQVPDYVTEIKGFDITNTYTQGKTSVTVTKEWQDKNNQDKIRPDSIKVQLLANGEKQGKEVSVSQEAKWTHTWSDLEAVDKKGQPIRYTVKEVAVPKGYTETYREIAPGSLGIVNTHTPKIPEKIVPPTKTKTGGSLPKTGEERTYLLSVLGLVAIVLMGRVTYTRRKEE